MHVQTLPKPPPLLDPFADTPLADPFPPATGLGDHLRRLHEEQAAIDKQKASELARLRAIQDRD